MENKNYYELNLPESIKPVVPAYFNCIRVFDVMKDPENDKQEEVDHMYIPRPNSIYKTSTFYTYGFQKPISKTIGLNDIFNDNE